MRYPRHWLGRLSVPILLAWCVLRNTSAAVAQADVATSEDGRTGPNQARLTLIVPDGTKTALGPGGLGDRKAFTLSPLEPGRLYQQSVTARFSNGAQVERTVLLKGGWNVRLALQPRDFTRPELVAQTGHPLPSFALVFSPDGEYLLTGSVDQTAILWHVATARQLRVYRGHSNVVSCVAFSPDGKRLLTGSYDSTVILWETATGKRLRTFPQTSPLVETAKQTLPVFSAAFSPDGKQVLASGFGDALLWDAQTGEQVQRFQQDDHLPKAVAFSPDGRRVLTGSCDGKVILWDAHSGEALDSLEGHSAAVHSAAFSPDGKQIVTGSDDKTAILWNAESGESQYVLQGHTEPVYSVAFRPDGKQVATAGFLDQTVILWNAQTGEQTRSFRPTGHLPGLQTAWSVAYSPDGQRLAIGSGVNSVTLWDVPSITLAGALEGLTSGAPWPAFSEDGQRIKLAIAYVGYLWDLRDGRPAFSLPKEYKSLVPTSAAWAGDGRTVILTLGDNNAYLFDVQTSKILQTLADFNDKVAWLAVSDDRSWALTATQSGERAILVDVPSGRRHDLKGHGGSVSAVALSRDGRYALTGSHDQTAVLWQVKTKEQVRTFKPGGGFLTSVAFSPDGQTTLVGDMGGTVTAWETATGRESRSYRPPKDALQPTGFNSMRAVTCSPDGRQVLAGFEDNSLIVWDARSAAILRVFRGHTGLIATAGFSRDGRYVVSGSLDGTMRLWDLATGNELAALIGLVPPDWFRSDPQWLVVTPDGFFDGSAGAREKVAFRVGGGLQLAPVDRFFQDFYRPGLLADVWAGQAPVPEVKLFQNQPPAVRIVSPEQDTAVEMPQTTLVVEVADQGGGVQGPWLFQNGARVLAKGTTERQENSVRRTFDISLIEGENRLEVRAASADGAWESEPAVRVLRYEKPLDKPALHVLAVGISQYAEGRYDLKFARADAQAFVRLFDQRGKSLYAPVNAIPLLDDQATAAQIRATMGDMARKARSQDTLLLFLAGHGAMVGQRYYFIAHDFQTRADRSRDDDIREQGIPVDTLGDVLSLGPALKRMLILDTCASGGAVDLFRLAGRNAFTFRGEIERLSRSQGVYVISATAATEEAKEAEVLGHGVLTYALLAGLRAVEGGPLERLSVQPSNPNQVVDVLEWFSFAAGHVPRLTRQFCNAEQNVHMAGRGGSFPVLPLRQD